MRTRSWLQVSIALIVAASLPISRASAQSATQQSSEAQAALAGVVSDSVGIPIAHATILTDSREAASVTNDSGQFHLAGLPPGEATFTVIRLGYRPLSFVARLMADTTIVVAIRLRSVQALPTIEVTARRLQEGLTRVGFYDRRHQGLGSYITPERIDSMRSIGRPSSLIRGVRGIEVSCPPQGGLTCVVRSRSGPSCLLLFIDGHYTETQMDELLSADDIAAIEVYERPALVPFEFQGPLPVKSTLLTSRAGCGAIAVWTRMRAVR